MALRLRPLLASGVIGLTLALSGRATAAHKPGVFPLSVSLSLYPGQLPAVRPPTTVVGPLNGEPTARAQALRRVVAVMIDNLAPDARPQSGLSRASVVIESLAEGGITRFMALYLEHDAPKVGPVRSSRLYFDLWASAFHAALAHVGGNDDAQALLWHLPSVFNVDEGPFETPSFHPPVDPFWRSTDRAAPHNAYLNTGRLRLYLDRFGQDWAYAGAALTHQSPAPPGQRGRGGWLSVAFIDPLNAWIPPNPQYTVRYVFNPARDTYLRYDGGAPQIDAATSQPLRPANVVIMITRPALPDANAGWTPDSFLIPAIGQGAAWYFRDGRVTRGVWRQHDQFAPLQLLDRQGHPVAFNPGQTWIEVVPQGGIVKWFFH